jgi:hypothetical protein
VVRNQSIVLQNIKFIRKKDEVCGPVYFQGTYTPFSSECLCDT